MTIEEYLEKYDILRKDFAKAIGISRQALHKLISKEYKPRIKTAFAIQRVTNGKVRAESLVGK